MSASLSAAKNRDGNAVVEILRRRQMDARSQAVVTRAFLFGAMGPFENDG
jgi:hypothetical protein